MLHPVALQQFNVNSLYLIQLTLFIRATTKGKKSDTSTRFLYVLQFVRYEPEDIKYLTYNVVLKEHCRVNFKTGYMVHKIFEQENLKIKLKYMLFRTNFNMKNTKNGLERLKISWNVLNKRNYLRFV